MLHIVGFLDKRFAKLGFDPAFNLEVVADEELPGRFGETVPSEHVIRIRETIYLKALAGDGFARQVMAHELWHYLWHNSLWHNSLWHNSETVSYGYVDDSFHIPDEINPEKQADAFAAELLAPSDTVRGKKIH
nr:ImmA/IrrE family metallo-endopeptidase [uncultured Agathobaculum sp.]